MVRFLLCFTAISAIFFFALLFAGLKPVAVGVLLSWAVISIIVVLLIK